MGTQAQPENQEQNQETQEQVEQSDTTQTTENNPPAPSSPAPTVDVNEVHNIYRGVLGEYSQRQQRLERELEELRNKQQQTRETTPEEDVELLTTNPGELIRREIQKSIAPLNQQAQEWTRATLKDDYIRRMKANPQYGFMQNEKFLPYFENTLSQIPQLNDGSVYAAYLASVGLFVQSPDYLQPTTPTPKVNQPTVHSQTVPTPPANNPAPPRQVPNNQNRGPKKVYTENEKLLMRLNNMTEEQWEAEMNLSPEQVVVGPNNG